MKISVDNFIESVDEWVEQKLLTKGTPIQQGIASFIYFQGKDKLKSYLSALSFLADENGDFNYADLEANLKKSFEKMGNQYKVPMLSYVFDTQDLNEILQIARGKTHE